MVREDRRANLDAAAQEVVREWRRFAESVSFALNEDIPISLHGVLRDSILTLDRSLILFLCGGEGGNRDKRDIQPSHFLGHDWFPPDDEMDQRLRGRLRVISKNRAHLTWHRVENSDAIVWPLALLAWETSWSFAQFILALRLAGATTLPIFEHAADEIRLVLPAREFRASTSEYAKARPGQVQF